MLVISRRSQEKLIINENITITVVSIEGGRIRLGIEATKDVAIRRGELASRQAADRSWHKRSRKIAVATASGPAPLRISEVRTIARAHTSIAAEVRSQRVGVTSMAACEQFTQVAGSWAWTGGVWRWAGAWQFRS